MLEGFKELMKDGRFRFAFIVICILALMSILSFFSPYHPLRWNVAPRDKPPSWPHIFGTTSQGQDLFWQSTFAIRNSLTIALIASGISRVIAIIMGLVSGYKGGKTDKVLMSINDSFVVMPLLPILILIATVIRENLTMVLLGLILSLFGWAWDARVIRSQILSLREREFTYTSILSGTRTFNLVIKEYFPFIIPIIFSTLINNMIWAVGMEVTLSVLGLSNTEIPTIGTMIYWAVNYQAMLLGYWWWILTPVIISIFLFVALYLLSSSLSEYLDPRTRIQRIGKAKE